MVLPSSHFLSSFMPGSNVMAPILRFPELALGELEQQVLEALWEADEALSPGSVHELVGAPRDISPNTTASALKRLHEKKLLTRRKVSHSYVYTPTQSRSEFQSRLIRAISSTFPVEEPSSMLAAFVDIADEAGEDTLRELEALVAKRLAQGD